MIAKSFAVAVLLGLLAVLYGFAIRPGQLRWGATAEELARPLPGDGLVPHPSFLATRAITISARPEDIWPWIVQIGYGRAGFYGYDLIENLGSQRGIRSAAKIVPELQRLKVGDRVYMSAVAWQVIHSMAPNQYLIWAGDQNPPGGAFTFALFPLDGSHTRLVNRFRFRYHWTDAAIPLELFTEFGDHVAVRKMLLGIKDRVEGRRVEPLRAQAVEIAVWMAAFLEFTGAVIFLMRAKSLWWIFVTGLFSELVLLFVLYGGKPVWIGAMMEIIILAALLRLWRADSARGPAASI